MVTILLNQRNYNQLFTTRVVKTDSGANPTIVSYNASAVKIYNATSTYVALVRFEKNKKTLY
jgi:hypothetical protein